jgi:AraC-like DNA-binding protein
LKDDVESPDLRALNLLASYHFPNYKYKKTSVQGTPMLRIGYEAILKASILNKRLIPQNGINDFISENQYFDSPFNTFKPIPFRKKITLKQEEIEKAQSRENEIPGTMVGSTTTDFKDIPQRGQIYAQPEELLFNSDNYATSIKSYIDENLFNFIQSKKESDPENSWVKNTITELIKKNEDLTIKDISTNLGVSENTVSRIFKEWNNEAKIKSGNNLK